MSGAALCIRTMPFSITTVKICHGPLLHHDPPCDGRPHVGTGYHYLCRVDRDAFRILHSKQAQPYCCVHMVGHINFALWNHKILITSYVSTHERGGAQTLLLSEGKLSYVKTLGPLWNHIGRILMALCMTTVLDKSPRFPRFLFRSLAILLKSKLLLLFSIYEIDLLVSAQ